ncbi:hypothetical protein IscW_ISCW007326 [Ixodes scapularis]|uniref:Uncharacterized protein n=1 Tax=Ixodes scapularis TaxID=6945 RepID=B7PUL2_IXOSC|nr:hypothetical protein IscW_ISCW007326 [Ixodes scapularis]|eukprot:XP_002406254.1 hypothetical protein IscW_ISCW007326 [Ixodes scapularis]
MPNRRADNEHVAFCCQFLVRRCSSRAELRPPTRVAAAHERRWHISDRKWSLNGRTKVVRLPGNATVVPCRCCSLLWRLRVTPQDGRDRRGPLCRAMQRRQDPSCKTRLGERVSPDASAHGASEGDAPWLWEKPTGRLGEAVQ